MRAFSKASVQCSQKRKGQKLCVRISRVFGRRYDGERENTLRRQADMGKIAAAECDDHFGKNTEFFGYEMGSKPIHNFGIILNGRYVDSGRLSAKLLDAVAMAKSLKELKPVNLSYENQVLEIEFPELEFNKKPFAQIIALNEGEEIVYVDFRNGGERVVHPKKVATNGRIVRNWDGSAMSLSVPVDDMPAQSYAVLVNSTDGGHLIAAGQVSTTKETLKTSSLEQ